VSTVTPPPPPSPKVVIVSIDGLRSDAVQQFIPPNLSALANKGAYTWRARTITPSNTLPSHASMLTGYLPARQGVTWDEYLPANGPIKVPTIFLAARKAGLRSAMVAGKEKFNTFRDTAEMDVFVGGTRPDADVADQAVAQLYTGVDLLFVHLPDVDLSGHSTAWMSTTYKDRVAKADEALGRIMRALPENTTLILTADHGGHGSRHGTNDSLDMSIPWIIAGPRIREAYALTGAISTMDTAATVGFILGLTLPIDLTGKPVLEAFAR
jgi:predicted AlkP superfamily pyrophosphatase or phosphodiesterase